MDKIPDHMSHDVGQKRLCGIPIRSYQLFLHIQARIDITLDRVVDAETGISRWAIRMGQSCLNKRGEWQHETMLSNRTDSFYRQCRWDEAEEAHAFWNELQIEKQIVEQIRSREDEV